MKNPCSNLHCTIGNNSFSKLIFLLSIIALSLMAVIGNAYAHGMGDHGDSPPPHWPYHAFLVSTGLIFMTSGMLIARHKKGRRWWLKAHKTMALFGASLALAGFFVAVYLVSTYLETYFVREFHAYLGAGAVMLVIAAPMAGFMQFRHRDMRIRVAHKWLGRVAIALISSNIIAGLQMILK